MFRVLSPVVTACVAESNHDNNSTNTGLGSLVPRMLLKVFHEGRVNNLNPDSETGFSAEASNPPRRKDSKSTFWKSTSECEKIPELYPMKIDCLNFFQY